MTSFICKTHQAYKKYLQKEQGPIEKVMEFDKVMHEEYQYPLEEEEVDSSASEEFSELDFTSCGEDDEDELVPDIKEYLLHSYLQQQEKYHAEEEDIFVFDPNYDGGFQPNYAPPFSPQISNNSGGMSYSSCASSSDTTSSTCCIRVINGVEDLGELIFDNFDLNSVPNQHCPLQFFITKCTPEILGPFLSQNFIDSLWYSSSWKVYIPEIIYGYISFLLDSQTQAITGSTNSSPMAKNGFFAKLVNFGKIVLLEKNEPQTISLSQQTIFNSDCSELQVIYEHYDTLSFALRFTIQKTCSTTTSSKVGTLIYQDNNGKRSGHPEKGFPLESLTASSLDEGRKEAYHIFAKRLEKLRKLMAKNPYTRYNIQFQNADRLVDLWYLKHLSDQFNTQIHVTPLFHRFIVDYIPDFEETFNPTNVYGLCRFSYGLENGTTHANKSNNCLPPSTFNESSVNPGSLKVSTIWVGSRSQVPEDISLFFIHDGSNPFDTISN